MRLEPPPPFAAFAQSPSSRAVEDCAQQQRAASLQEKGCQGSIGSIRIKPIGMLRSLAGAMLGGLLLGLIESLGAGYLGDLTGGVFGSNYRDVFAFLVLVLVLTLRPSGLMGVGSGDRA